MQPAAELSTKQVAAGWAGWSGHSRRSDDWDDEPEGLTTLQPQDSRSGRIRKS